MPEDIDSSPSDGPVGQSRRVSKENHTKMILLTIDISALARNFCTAFFLSSRSASSLFALIDVAAGMIVVACKYDIGGDAEDVAEDDGVAMRLAVVLNNVSGTGELTNSLFEGGDGRGMPESRLGKSSGCTADYVRDVTQKRVHCLFYIFYLKFGFNTIASPPAYIDPTNRSQGS